MNDAERARIEQLIGRKLTAVEIGRGSVDRPQDSTLRERIAVANQQTGHQQRWKETTLEHDLTRPKRETRASAQKRMRESQEQRTEDKQAAADRAAKLATDATYLKMNRISEQALERARWDASIPQSRWENLVAMREAARNDSREEFKALNASHSSYLETITTEKQATIDAEIERLNSVKKSLNEDRFEEPLPTPEPTTYSHIRRSSGMMQFISKTDGEIFEYDPKVPHAKELAMDRLAQHQVDTADKYGEPIPAQ